MPSTEPPPVRRRDTHPSHEILQKVGPARTRSRAPAPRERTRASPSWRSTPRVEHGLIHRDTAHTEPRRPRQSSPSRSTNRPPSDMRCLIAPIASGFVVLGHGLDAPRRCHERSTHQRSTDAHAPPPHRSAVRAPRSPGPRSPSAPDRNSPPTPSAPPPTLPSDHPQGTPREPTRPRRHRTPASRPRHASRLAPPDTPPADTSCDRPAGGPYSALERSALLIVVFSIRHARRNSPGEKKCSPGGSERGKPAGCLRRVLRPSPFAAVSRDRGFASDVQGVRGDLARRTGTSTVDRGTDRGLPALARVPDVRGSAHPVDPADRGAELGARASRRARAVGPSGGLQVGLDDLPGRGDRRRDSEEPVFTRLAAACRGALRRPARGRPGVRARRCGTGAVPGRGNARSRRRSAGQ